MYAETELMFPFFQNFSQDFQQLEDFSCSHKSTFQMGNLVETSTISEYDMGGEGDLFKAPKPIIEEPAMAIHPMTAAISMISRKVDIESIQNEQLLSDVFYEAMETPLSDLMDIKIPIVRMEENLVVEYKPEGSFQKNLMGKEAMVTPVSGILDLKNHERKEENLVAEYKPEGSFQKDLMGKEAMVTPVSGILDLKNHERKEENLIAEDKLPPEDAFQKSISSGCLNSMDWRHGAPNFLDFHGTELGGVYGMRRAFSEGDIKTLGNGNISIIQSPFGRPPNISNCTTEDRKEKLSRYRNKKTKRNFGRKIKYACRKTLADSQPRIRGRFAKTEDSDISKKQ